MYGVTTFPLGHHISLSFSMLTTFRKVFSMLIMFLNVFPRYTCMFHNTDHIRILETHVGTTTFARQLPYYMTSEASKMLYYEHCNIIIVCR